ncbi:MAG TPA: glutamine amidotransferase [Corynebacterium sp.]|uniref:glutamine amidotransferase n=1 Tax=Corynebacterium sp. TaxID=1720 RepID=UPI00180DCF64|nr:glutamine amidotransferase [Corynebacterium sp.]HHT31777.1 glutamine amidotransferase [Corynebacterium sp.]
MSSSADFSAAPGPADRRPATTSRAQAPAKPFLLLSTRAEDAAAHAEQLSFARAAGLAPAMLHQLRLERERPKALDLERYGGVIVGGGPYNASDELKSAVQLEVEAWFDDHLAEVLETDFPFFGACYGVGLLGTVGRGRVSRKHGEEAAVVEVSVTPEGASDPVLAGLPERFHAMVGHKEAIEELPAGATLLATGASCPVQMFRLGRNAYASQFHPELDADTFEQRLRIYADQGYYQPGGNDRAVADARRFDVARSAQVLRNFTRLHSGHRG